MSLFSDSVDQNGERVDTRRCWRRREDDELSVDPKKRKTQSRLTKPEPNAKYQCRALLLAMGVRAADGGRRGRWGEARLVGAGETSGARRGQWEP